MAERCRTARELPSSLARHLAYDSTSKSNAPARQSSPRPDAELARPTYWYVRVNFRSDGRFRACASYGGDSALAWRSRTAIESHAGMHLGRGGRSAPTRLDVARSVRRPWPCVLSKCSTPRGGANGARRRLHWTSNAKRVNFVSPPPSDSRGSDVTKFQQWADYQITPPPPSTPVGPGGTVSPDRPSPQPHRDPQTASPSSYQIPPLKTPLLQLRPSHTHTHTHTSRGATAKTANPPFLLEDSARDTRARLRSGCDSDSEVQVHPSVPCPPSPPRDRRRPARATLARV
ncbi:hypothetical protein OF83DRAFT_839190 [Amylostereum chailletii]|nr:hypothetical protein OF83DRAFT_839190 [Amylostereum chailletii]